MQTKPFNDIVTYQSNYSKVLPSNGEVILEKTKFKIENVKEAEGLTIGRYYYCIYYDFSYHWDREESEHVIDNINIYQVSRSLIDGSDGDEYIPVYEFSRMQWEDIMQALTEYINNHEIEY